MNKKINILCFGEVLWDRLPSGSKPGGAPLNVAVHLKANGLNVSIASKIGNDDSGKELQQFLQNSGVNTELLEIDKSHTTSEVLVYLDENKNATYEICEPVAWDFIENTPKLMKASAEADFIVYGSLASRNKTTFNTLLQVLENKGLKIMDVNFRPPFDKKEIVEKLLHKTNIAKLNNEELNEISGWYAKSDLSENEQMSWFSSFYKLEMVCLTKGDKGAKLAIENKLYSHPGFKVKTEDTVGAGDAFLAGLIASIVKNKEPKDALSFACATGAFVASKKGATPAYNFNEIEDILRSQ
jgi:fructokinase